MLKISITLKETVTVVRFIDENVQKLVIGHKNIIKYLLYIVSGKKVSYFILVKPQFFSIMQVISIRNYSQSVRFSLHVL